MLETGIRLQRFLPKISQLLLRSAAGTGRIDEERIANALRQQVIGLGVTSGAIAREAVPDPGTGPSGAIRR